MPPRNSDTKAYRKYRTIGPKNETNITKESIYESIIDPTKAINNPYNTAFEQYRAQKIASGEIISDSIDRELKDDDDGDPRYVNKKWYQNKAKGFS